MIGTKLFELRTLHNMSQSDLARLINVSVKSIKNWENDISAPCLISLKALASVFCVSADEFIGITLDSTVSLAQLDPQEQNTVRKVLQVYIAEANKYRKQRN